MNKKKRIISAMVQARTGSTRLPGKVLKEVCGKAPDASLSRELMKFTNESTLYFI